MTTITPEMRDALEVTGRKVQFAQDEVLRLKGAFAPDMLLITDGQVACFIDDDVAPLTLGPNTIVGERGFLTGQSANATLRAMGPVSALAIDSAVLAKLQSETPQIAAQVLRHLARIMSERDAINVDLTADGDDVHAPTFEILRCSTLDQLRMAQRLRYDVFCVEFGRNFPHADRVEGTLADILDTHGTSFLAVDGGQVVGTARVNLGRDGALGILPDLFGVEASRFSLGDSAIITSYAIRDSHRGGFTFLRLFSAIGSFVQSSSVRAIFIDCAPKLARFYAKAGFERSSEDFVHFENGLSVPMVLDVDAYFEQLPFDEHLRRNRLL